MTRRALQILIPLGVLCLAGCGGGDSGGPGPRDAAVTGGTGGRGGAPGTGGTGGSGGTGGVGGTGGTLDTLDAATQDANPQDANSTTQDASSTQDASADVGTGDGGSVGPSLSFFIVSEVGSANLDGLAGADAKCKRLATAVGQGDKNWRAYLSTSNPMVHARERIGKGPWYNAMGVKIADDVPNLHDGSTRKNNLTATTALDERGRPVPGSANRPTGTMNEHDVLTGSNMDGTLAMGATCSDWKSDGAGAARVGHFDRAGGGPATATTNATSWNSSHNSRGCSLLALRGSGGAGRFYCFVAN